VLPRADSGDAVGHDPFFICRERHRTEAIGELVWIDPTKKTGGLRFTSMSLASRERIRNWLDQAAAVPNAGAVSEPAPPRARISPLPGVDPVQSNAAPRGYVPPPGTPVIQPTMPGFALLEAESQHMPYTWEQEMARQEYRPKFFQGFVTGALITAILAAIAFFVYGNPAAVLAQWRAMTAATPRHERQRIRRLLRQPFRLRLRLKHYHVRATRKRLRLPRLSPTHRAIRKRVAQPFQRPRNRHLLTITPRVLSRARRLKTADNGDAEFAMAERYLREKSGPGSSAAAANSLWAAVKKGNISAEIALADLYARGDGVTKNCDQARVLLRAAAEKGSSIASQQLARVVRSGCR